MTDSELILRLEETPPEEWTAEELAQLQLRATENTAVRNALADHLRFEQALTQGLTHVRVTADQVLARIEARRRGPLRFGPWLRAAALVVALGAGGGVWYALRNAPPDDRAANVGQAPGIHMPAPVVPRGTKQTPPPSSPIASTTGTAAPSTPIPTATAAARVAPDEPWSAMLDAPPIKFDDFWDRPRKLSRDVEGLQRWWTTITGQQRPTGNDDRFGLHLAGFFELRAPWPIGKTLTLWTADQQNDILRLHIWAGTRGLTLEQRQRPYEQWAAYATTKRPHEPLPETYAYAAGDNDRARRTGEGPIDLRYHDGRVHVSRGDILLLAAPLESPPEAVYFEGTATLKGIGLADVEGLPARWQNADKQHPQFFDYAEPVAWPALAADEWLTELPPGAEFQADDDGGGTLSLDNATKPAWAALRIEREGLYDLVCEVTEADAQTGLYLGDEQGRPRYSLGFYEHRQGEALHVGAGRPTEAKPNYKYDPKRGPMPAVGSSPRIRLICGAGVVKVYASHDGRSWGRIMDPIRGVDGVPPTVGIYCAPGKTPRSITLARVRRHDYFVVDAKQPPAATPSSLDYGTWLVDALADEAATGDDDALLQRRAAAQLTSGARSDMARTLLTGLTTPLDARRPSALVGLRLIDFNLLCLAADLPDLFSSPQWYGYLLDELGRPSDEAAAGVPDDFAAFDFERRRWMEAPLSGGGRLPFLPPELIQRQILELFRRHDWDELDRVCRTLHFFGGRPDPTARKQPQREPIMELVDWAAALAERRRSVAPGLLPAPPQFTFKPEWRHPLIEQFGKEGYNVLAELETALQEKAYPDACRIITGVTAAQAVGLLPNAADPDLLVSLPGAVAQAMRTHVELRTTMQRDYGDLAQLRFRQATADGDVDAVEALTTQFYGTAAAAQAQTWLGDRALAQGDAPRAEGHYRSARSEMPAGGDLAAVAARLRLAAAMQGRDDGDAPQASVVLGQWTLTPAEFERTCRELRASASAAAPGPRSSQDASLDELTSPIPPPTRFTVEMLATLEGDVGKNPEQPPIRDVDFVGAQLAATFGGGRLIVSNRFQIAAYDVDAKKLAWRAALGGEQGRTYQWPRVAMRPIPVDERIYVRRLTAAGPELACLAAADGQLLWRSPRGEIVACDPLVVGDRVLAVVLTVPQQDVLEASLVAFEAGGGKVLVRRPLVQFRDFWKRELNAHLISAGDALVVHIAGCVIGCSPEGDLRWLRRLPWIPPSIASWSSPEREPSPRIVDGKLLVAGPAQADYRVDVRSGAVDTHEARTPLGRLDAAEEDQAAAFRRLVHDHDLFRSGNLELNRKLWRPYVTWRSASEGTATISWPMPWQKQRPSVGPFAAHDGRYWALVAADLRSPSREIVELISGSPIDVEPPDVVAEPLDGAWQSLLPEPLRKLGYGRFGPWSLVQSRYDEKLWTQNARFQTDDCRLTLAGPEAPALWTRRVTLPQGSPKALNLRVAAAADQPWTLAVRVGDDVVLERTIEPAADAAWRDERVDLKPYAGRTIQLTLVHRQALTDKRAPPAAAAWQSMAIVDQ